MANEWYYASGGVQNGPVGLEDLRARHVAGQIPADALIWREGMDGWKPWSQVPELAANPQLITGAPPVASSGGNVYAPPGSNPVTNQVGMGGMAVRPPTYLWQSIACTLLCCLPFGIVGIVYASKVESNASIGNAAAAIEASNKAKFWCWMSFGFGLGFTVLYLLAVVGGGLAA